MMWREHKIPLILMTALLLGNIFFFFTYRVQYTTRLSDLDARQEQAQHRLAEAQRARAAAQQQLSSYDRVRADLEALYNERWSTQSARFTRLFEEVKRLATASNFDPRSFAFSRTEMEKGKDAGSAGSTVVNVAFMVQGTYEQVRRLINLIELSDQFMIIDGIALSGGDPADPKMLTMSIRLKTLFHDPQAAVPPRRTNRQL
jgi:hypothetical protein